eukprot:508551-Hanusia_phi.AAC.1
MSIRELAATVGGAERLQSNYFHSMTLQRRQTRPGIPVMNSYMSSECGSGLQRCGPNRKS